MSCPTNIPTTLMTDQQQLIDEDTSSCVDLNQLDHVATLGLLLVLSEQHTNLTLTMIAQNINCKEPYLVVSVKLLNYSSNCKTDTNCLVFKQCKVTNCQFQCPKNDIYDTVYLLFQQFNQIFPTLCSLSLV